MAASNHERVGKGLALLRQGLIPWAMRALQSSTGANWWASGVARHLTGTQGLDARRGAGTDAERFAALDLQALTAVLLGNWNEVYGRKLGTAGRTYVHEVRDVCSKWADQQPFTVDDAYRALDTMTRLLQFISAEEARETERLARELLRQRYDKEAKRELRRGAQAATETGTLAGLKPWREVITPHPDVASGRYQQAEFAADLAQVLRGEADEEYGNPVEFFRRTYVTEGLSQLLTIALRRLSGTGGDPVIQLQTSFGGGKTHSMLALYHLFSGEASAAQIPGVETLLQAAGVNGVPVARRAVLVGTDLSAHKTHPKPDGVVVHTLWGEMAYQLGGRAGYDLVALADERGISPGADVIKELFDRFGPALVLVDEWVAYARNIYGVSGLPAGSFEANMTFVQALTEGARNAHRALVVATIPASHIEIGGEGGQAALERISHVFGRLESIWRPAGPEESFEIVRRRLFSSEVDFAARDAVVRAFVTMYRDQRAEFPRDCAEADYERRLKACYPIHPEMFDRLYQDWSTLDRFQRTRGVLRLMAAVIHELWDRQDRSLLIMPGTVPLDNPAVQREMLRYLPESWSAVLDSDIDGQTSRSLTLDRENPNLGRYSACRRVARTIFVGSAPTVEAERVRGVEEVRVKLGCVQPGESPATFGDALRWLTERSTYLYGNASRYWFDTRPSVNRTAADRADQILRQHDLVEQEIIRRLRAFRDKGDFAAVHLAPQAPADVADDQAARLVVLGPTHVHTGRMTDSPGLRLARDILESRGAGPRQYRNMLVFLAPDKDRAPELERAVSQYLAWLSIQKEEAQLNLDAHQRAQVRSSLKHSEETVEARLQETYGWLLVPAQDGTGPVEWESVRLPANGENHILRASRKLRLSEQLLTAWSPALLRLELDRWLWREAQHLSIRQLWEYLCKYLYLPRLRDEQVLLHTIREGVRGFDFFAYASSVTPDGRYRGLEFAAAGATIHMDGSSVVVRPEAARRQLDLDRDGSQDGHGGIEAGPSGRNGAGPEAGPPPAPSQPRRPETFFGEVRLDPTRVGRDASQIAQEVIQHLVSLMNARVEVSLTVRADVPGGVSEDTVRTVTENCRILRFSVYMFDNR